MRVNRYGLLVLCLGFFGCGGSCPQAAEATSASEEAAEEKPMAKKEAPEPEQKTEEAAEKAGSEESSAPSEGSAAGNKTPAAAEPQFPEHASVGQAIAAIPRGGERANIEPDKLSEPLQNEALWEPCKVGAQHFKVKVAIWDGHAVGVDVATTSKKLAECIDRQVRSVEWKDKVKSLNTVEYAL